MYAATRWLNIYEITISHIYRFDALVVLYFSFLSDGDKILYKSRLDAIYSRRKATEESKKAIKKHQSFLKNKKKNLTKDGKARREEYVENFSTRKQRPNYKRAFIPQH